MNENAEKILAARSNYDSRVGKNNMNVKLNSEQECLEVLNSAIAGLYAVHGYSEKDQDEKEELYEIINRVVDYRHKTYKYDIKWESVKIDEP